jgi:hypothetical protein
VRLETGDAGNEARERGLLHSAADRDDVDARNTARGIGDPVGETRVGGQQQQPARREVQTADRDQTARLFANDVVDRSASLGIAPGRNHAARLVEDDCPPVRACLRLIVEHDANAFGRDGSGRVADDPTVDAHAAGANGDGGLRAREQPELRESPAERDAPLHDPFSRGNAAARISSCAPPTP